MYGFALWLIWTFFEEISNSITKRQSKKYDIFQLWLVISFFALIFYIAYALIKVVVFGKNIYVNPDSFLFLWIRLILEILQSYFTVVAIKKVDRSTYSMLRILTIPGLLIIDFLLWYSFSFYSILWLIVLMLCFVVIWLNNNKINFSWWKYVVFISLNAVITLSLFKYSITIYGNSVEFDQIVVVFWILLFYLFFTIKYKLSLLNLLKDRIFLLQWISMGIATVLISFSYLFLNASLATAIKRGWEVFWSIIFWYKFFGEKNIIFKLFVALWLFTWLLLCAF